MRIAESSVLEPIHIVSERPIQWPTLTGGTAPSSGVPIHAMPILVKNNVQLAAKPATKPPHPTIAQVLTPLPLSLQFAFNQVTLPVGATNIISSYRVYRNTTANNFSGAMLMRTFVHDPTRQGAITVQDNTGSGKQYYYFVTSVDTTSQESVPVAAQAGAITSGNANPNVAQGTGVTGDPSTTSTSYVTIPEMTVTITTHGNPIIMMFSGLFNVNEQGFMSFFRDAVQLNGDISITNPVGSTPLVFSMNFIDVGATAGSHTFTVKWKATAGTLNTIGTQRSLQVIELG